MAGVALVSIVIALIVRTTIKEFTFEDIATEEYLYDPYIDVEYSNGAFQEVTPDFNVVDESEYILKVQVTGSRELLEGTVKTQIEILDVMKGTLAEKAGDLYEPIDISMMGYHNSISSFGGYNLLKEGKEYIICVTYSPKLQAFMYVTPMLGKFPKSYDENDYLVIQKTDDKESQLKYQDYNEYEQLFETQEMKELYFKTYESLWK